MTTPSSVAPAVRAEIHHSHRDVTGGWLRPAVFGVMDGLVSNVALLSGVAGGHASHQTILLTGFAGLAAGAVSMATGEYVSVASQSELIEAEIAVEKAELIESPEAEQAELAALYRARGLTPELAKEVARQLSADHEQVWRVHAREELGVDPDDLPSPYLAAGSSFVAFAVGALVPLLPYLFGAQTLLWALVLTAVALFAAGTAVAALTSRSWVYAGTRQLALGVVAAGVSYLVGVAVGSAV